MKRVVTGVDEHGRSFVLSNEEFTQGDPWFVEYDPRAELKEWIEGYVGPGPVDSDVLIPNVAGGLRFHYVVLPASAGEAQGAGRDGIDVDGFHATRSVDFVVIQRGTITLVLDDGPIQLATGDCLIQQASRHAWCNDSGAPVEMMFVMLRPDYAR